MLKVLHYIQTAGMGKDNDALPYTEALIQCTENEVESYVVKQNEVGSNWLFFRRHFLKKLEEIRPDIVHVHGSWNYYTAFAEKLARKHGYLTVLSPHGQMAPEVIEPDFWKKKLPRILYYQLGLIKNNKYLIATNEKEEKDLKKLGWKKRIVTIPATSDETDAEKKKETNDLIIAAYQKVIDSNYLTSLTEDEKDLVNTCLRAAIWQGNTLPEDLDFTNEEKPSIEGLSMRRIYIYTYDNDVINTFLKGAKKLDISLPEPPDVEKIPRFKQKKRKRGRWEKNIEKLCAIISSMINNNNEGIKAEYTPTGTLSLKTYCSIYTALRFNDYDEDVFNTQIGKKRIKKTTARLMTKLRNDMGLEEGFMPLLPK